MSTVIMTCGVCGSGKTTYAKEKEKEGFLRLSIDERMWADYGQRGVDYPESQYEALSQQTETALRQQMLDLIRAGKNLVIDFSFWSRENREFYRSLIRQAGGVPQLVYLKADLDLLRRRLFIRNQTLHANSPFVITEETLLHHYYNFQPPQGEGEIIIPQQG